MLVAAIEIAGPRGQTETDAIIDTGFSGGLVFSKSMARKVGAILVSPRRRPKLVDGRAIRGKATIVVVSIPDAGVRAEVVAYCPDSPPIEPLVGAYFLAKVRAMLTVGKLEFRFAKVRSNPTAESLRDMDMSDWRIPLDRPATPWWGPQDEP